MAILQSTLPIFPGQDKRLDRLPGIAPLDPANWLVVDDAFAGQMQLRDRLIAEHAGDVHRLAGSAYPAAVELYRMVLARLPQLGHRLGTSDALRPDGVRVPLDPARPLLTLGRLVQEDLCILQPGPSGEHILTGAILCFPASWTLAEKIGRPLTRIHDPVPDYDGNIAARVQRLFDAMHPNRPLWRMNWNAYASADLYHPRREADPRPTPDGPAPYLRSERQCLLRLPQTQAVVFSIHTYVVDAANVDTSI